MDKIAVAFIILVLIMFLFMYHMVGAEQMVDESDILSFSRGYNKSNESGYETTVKLLHEIEKANTTDINTDVRSMDEEVL